MGWWKTLASLQVEEQGVFKSMPNLMKRQEKEERVVRRRKSNAVSGIRETVTILVVWTYWYEQEEDGDILRLDMTEEEIRAMEMEFLNRKKRADDDPHADIPVRESSQASESTSTASAGKSSEGEDDDDQPENRENNEEERKNASDEEEEDSSVHRVEDADDPFEGGEDDLGEDFFAGMEEMTEEELREMELNFLKRKQEADEADICEVSNSATEETKDTKTEQGKGTANSIAEMTPEELCHAEIELKKQLAKLEEEEAALDMEVDENLDPHIAAEIVREVVESETPQVRTSSVLTFNADDGEDDEGGDLSSDDLLFEEEDAMAEVQRSSDQILKAMNLAFANNAGSVELPNAAPDSYENLFSPVMSPRSEREVSGTRSSSLFDDENDPDQDEDGLDLDFTEEELRHMELEFLNRQKFASVVTLEKEPDTSPPVPRSWTTATVTSTEDDHNVAVERSHERGSFLRINQKSPVEHDEDGEEQNSPQDRRPIASLPLPVTLVGAVDKQQEESPSPHIEDSGNRSQREDKSQDSEEAPEPPSNNEVRRSSWNGVEAHEKEDEPVQRGRARSNAIEVERPDPSLLEAACKARKSDPFSSGSKHKEALLRAHRKSKAFDVDDDDSLEHVEHLGSSDEDADYDEDIIKYSSQETEDSELTEAVVRQRQKGMSISRRLAWECLKCYFTKLPRENRLRGWATMKEFHSQIFSRLRQLHPATLDALWETMYVQYRTWMSCTHAWPAATRKYARKGRFRTSLQRVECEDRAVRCSERAHDHW